MNVPRFGLIGLAVLTLAAVVNVAAFYTAERSFAELRKDAAGVRHTQQAEYRIEHIYRRVVDAETGQRGFVLTLDPTYLQPYLEARREIPRELEELGSLTQSNPVQVMQIATVKKLLDARLAEMDQSLTLKRDHGDDALRQFLISHQGVVTMSSLRLALDGMSAEERTQYERRAQSLAENQDQIRSGMALVAGLNLVLVTLGAITLYQESRRRRRETIEVDGA